MENTLKKYEKLYFDMIKVQLSHEAYLYSFLYN
jgi:hypothetical protein